MGLGGPTIMYRAGAALLALGAVASIPAVAAKCGPAMVQVTVLDQGGTALSGLAPSDFKVRIKNQGVTVAAVDYGVFPHSTLLLISRTSSMGQSLKIELARRLAQSVVAGAPGNVMGGSYGSDVSGIADARAGQAFGTLQAGTDNRNVIYDAVIAGMSTMNLHRGDAVVVITDSQDNGSKTTSNELVQRFATTGARLFIIALPPASEGGTMQSLTQLAESTGGATLVPLHVDDTTKGIVISPAQVEGAVTTLTRSFTQYNNIYQLETDAEGQDKALPLRVEIDRRKLGAGKVVAPTVLAPCTSVGQ